MSLNEVYETKQITADQCKLLVKVIEDMPSMPSQWWDDIGRVLGTSGKAARERLRYLKQTLSPKLSYDGPTVVASHRRPKSARSRTNSQSMRATTSGRKRSVPVPATSSNNNSPVRLRQIVSSLQDTQQRGFNMYALPTGLEGHQEYGLNNEDSNQQANEPFPSLPLQTAPSDYGQIYNLPYTSRATYGQPHSEQSNTQLSPELFVDPFTHFTLTQEPTETIQDIFNDSYGQDGLLRKP